MDKIGIEKIRCFHPLGFYACWMVVLAWMTLSVVSWGLSPYQPLLDSIGLMGFGAIFLMIAGTFGTILGKKVFLCNVYDSVAKDFKKLILMESLILLVSLGLAFDMGFGSVNGHSSISIDSWNGIMRSSAAVFFCVFLAKSISKLILERYTGRIINLCTDVILLPNLLVLVVFSGYHDYAKLLVVLLVYHFLYTLYRIVRCKG